MTFDEDDETLYIYKGGDAHFPAQGFPTVGIVPRKVSQAKISDLTNSIGRLAFYNCSLLESITIPKSVTKIDDGAFKSCTKLASIKIPSSVTSIGAGAFYDCTSLQSVHIPDSITSISIAAFYGCSSLSTLRLPSSITKIGKSAFKGCSSLSAIRIPENVTLIEENAFDGCKALLALYVPSSSKNLDGGDDHNKNDLKVEDGAFRGCPCLEVVRKDEGKSCEMGLEEHECLRGNSEFHRLCNISEININAIEVFLLENKGICRRVDSSGRTGLHVLAFNPSVTVKAINLLLDYYPSAAQVRDGNGLYPLHYLCMNEAATVEMITPLINSYPNALKADAEGKYGLPLKFALWNNVSTDVIKILFSRHPIGEDKVRVEDKSKLHRELCNWNTTLLEEKLREVPDDSVRTKKFLSQLLHQDPSQHPSMEEVAKHIIFKKKSDIEKKNADLNLQLDEAKLKNDAELIEKLETEIRAYEEDEVSKPPKVEPTPTLQPPVAFVSAKPVQARNEAVESQCGCMIQ